MNKAATAVIKILKIALLIQGLGLLWGVLRGDLNSFTDISLGGIILSFSSCVFLATVFLLAGGIVNENKTQHPYS